jgi:uncharacterized repeat protein (TIGR04052 family)
MKAVAIKFRAMVGEEPFTCGPSYENIGITNSKITPTDFRFYVHNIRLIDEMGNEVPVQLDQDGQWQVDNLALLDFEDGTGPCSNGTTDVNDTVTGQVPAGTYQGIRFIVGVPFDKNHQDPLTQPSPLNISQMFWVWNIGYKFVRIDLRSTGLPRGYFVHLGSTRCTPNNTVLTVPTSCANPNRPEITLEAFDPESDVIVADLRALLGGANVDVNQSGTSAGCESSPSDGDCAPLFHSLGLPFAGVPSTGQTFFRAEHDH